jgi:predicted outer membrane protein
MKVLYVAKLVILSLSIMCIARLMSAQSQSSTGELGPVDTYFVTQTSLGTPFQVDSGNLAVTKGTTQAIRDYAQLMVSSHVAVNDALDAILRKKPAVPPPTLLKAAYSTMISTLEREDGKAFDSDYVKTLCRCPQAASCAASPTPHTMTASGAAAKSPPSSAFSAKLRSS